MFEKIELHHMFTVGLDVDTVVSTRLRLKFEVFWLFAGTSIKVESIVEKKIFME